MNKPLPEQPLFEEDPLSAQLYERIALILSIGFWTSIAIIIFGVVVAIIQDADLEVAAIDLEHIFSSLADFEAAGLISLGLLVLLLTPSAYVIAALLMFLQRKDWLFTGVCTTLVLLILGTIGAALL